MLLIQIVNNYKENYVGGRPWSVCEVVLVPYVDAVDAVTVIRVLL